MTNEKTLNLYKIDIHYIQQLNVIDKRVQFNSQHSNYDKKPYIGILFTENGHDFFVPISSPKPKHLKMHNSLDFFKLDEGKLGAVNFNNMIPVNKKMVTKINIKKDFLNSENQSNRKYGLLLNKQLQEIQEKKVTDKLIRQAKTLYFKYQNNTLPKHIKSRCVDFKKIEEYLKLNLQNEKISTTKEEETISKPQFSIAGLRQRQQEIDNKNQPIKIKKKSR